MNENKMLQLTLAIIKPHVIKQPHALENIRERILNVNFKVIRSKRHCLTVDQAKTFYEEHKNKFFYNRLVTFMTSGPSDFYILARLQAINEWRRLMGPTKVFKAQFTDPDSIRGTFGLSDTRNATHGSDSTESAEREIKLVFPDFDIQSWYQNEEKFFRENHVTFNKKDFVHYPIHT